jgi:hypothetical protein
MNYFTPDLLTRFRAGEIDTNDWEKAGDDYDNHLNSIRSEIPEEVLRALDSLCFHDAKVLTISVDESPHLSIFLKLDGPRTEPENFVILRYQLAGASKDAVRLIRHHSLAGDGKPLGWWLFDEIDVVKEDQRPTFRQSVLFTGGCELQVTFTGVTASHVQFFLPHQALASEPEDKLDELELLSA